jgi:AcrR family transcriptional regulator
MQKSGGRMEIAGETPPRPRGRPRAFDREAALALATRLFWSKGYAATSIADLTEIMGIGAPSLYAAFGSKEALYAEALGFYSERFGGLVWSNFAAAATARDAVASFLFDSAAALAGSGELKGPRGCMVTLSSVGCEGHAELGELVKAARAASVARIEERLGRAVAAGELAAGTDIAGLARFVVAAQAGMSFLARDGAGAAELKAVAAWAMRAWPSAIG